MPEEPFLLVSLEEHKAKILAQVLSNDTARKILDHLSKKEHATETEISKDMGIPLSTAHYNLDLLVKSGLVNDEQFTYSEKGKQIVHYSLSNKYVIIAPKKTELLKEKLMKFLPVAAFAGIASAIINYSGRLAEMLPFNNKAAEDAMLMALPETKDIAAAGARMLPDAQAVQMPQEIAVWFLFGSVFALLIYFVWAEVIIKNWKKR